MTPQDKDKDEPQGVPPITTDQVPQDSTDPPLDATGVEGATIDDKGGDTEADLGTTTEELPKGDESEDVVTDDLVDDIVAHESDQLLQAQDQTTLAITPPKKKGFFARIGGAFSAFWHNKKARNSTLIGFGIIVVALFAYPTTRYAILNTFGVRASTTVRTVDAKSGQPIRNVTVTVAGVSGQTAEDGSVTLTGVKLGKTTMTFQKRSFKTLTQDTVIGWGSNQFTEAFQLEATGTHFTFTVTSWINDQPIPKAEVTDGESVAVADDKGVATLVVQPTDADLEVTIRAEGYRSEKIVIGSTDTEGKKQQLVPDRPDVFVSNRSGKYDLYRRDLDGQNEAILFAATGNETADIGLVTRQEGDRAGFVSTRDGKKNNEGYALSNLYIVDVKQKSATKVEGTEAESITLHGWAGDVLIFEKSIAAPSAGNNRRTIVSAYSLQNNKVVELGAANYFNDIKLIDGLVYMVPNSGGIPGGSASVQLVRIAPDGSAKTTMVNQEVYNVIRTDLKTLFSGAPGNVWFTGLIGTAPLKKTTSAPANPMHREYVKAPSGNSAAWVDIRDGKGALLVADSEGKETQIVAASGLTYPMRWVSSSQLLVTVRTSQETASYIVDIPTKTMKKIGDITAVRRSQFWYY